MMDNVPLNVPIYLIDHKHKLYKGTMIKVRGELQRGECIEGDPEEFYRNAIIAWAYAE